MLSLTSLARVSARYVVLLKTVVIIVSCTALEQRTSASNGEFIKLWENFLSTPSRMASSLRSKTLGSFRPLWILSLCQKVVVATVLTVLTSLLMARVCIRSFLTWGSRLVRSFWHDPGHGQNWCGPAWSQGNRGFSELSSWPRLLQRDHFGMWLSTVIVGP